MKNPVLNEWTFSFNQLYAAIAGYERRKGLPEENPFRIPNLR
jgi:hypothetical protein